MRRVKCTSERNWDEWERNMLAEVGECALFSLIFCGLMVLCTYLALGSPWQ